MAISLGDALLTLGVDTKDFDKGIKGAESSIGDLAKSAQKSMLVVGGALATAGGAVVAMAGMSVKAWADEEAGIIKLQTALRNVGVSYDNVKSSLEANITATQYKTGQADDKQRAALANLIALTGNYDTALKLLPLSMDLAVAKSMDLEAASNIIARVSMGNTAILGRYGIQLREGATATEALGMLQQKFGGQADAYGKSTAGAFAKITAATGDLKESIGKALAPAISALLDQQLLPLVKNLMDFAERHPGVVKAITAIGVAMAGLGATLITVSLAMTANLIPNIITLIARLGVLAAATWTYVAAQVASLALAGPAGWAILIGAATATAIGLSALTAAAIRAGVTMAGATPPTTEGAYPFGSYTDAMGRVYDESGKQIGGPMMNVSTSAYALGGVVPGPIGQAVSAVVHGGETIIPAGQSMASVSITGNNFYVRDESDIDRIGQAIVDKIRARTGVKI